MFHHAAHTLLRPFGKGYAQIMRLRQHLYATGRSAFWHPWRPPAPCVSVGNIAMGGTGKTPVTAWILEQAVRAGCVPACLTRGYRAKPPHLPFHVRADSDPAQCGDEPLLLTRSCPQAHVLVDPTRSRAGRHAATTLHPGLYVLDDGFQHMAVARDLDLVLLRPEDLEQDWNRVFPAGYWREGASALHRAHAFCIKAAPERFQSLEKTMAKRLQPFGKPVFGFSLAGRDLMNISTGKTIANLDKAPYLFAAGIAHPDQAVATAQKILGNAPNSTVSFRDHANFTRDDLERLIRTARSVAAAHIVVTEKDAVKLEHLARSAPSSSSPPIPDISNISNIWAVRTRVVFHGRYFTSSAFDEFFTGWLHAAAKEDFS
jgi:tetraacyldisaccharide 4'-kinase